MRLVIYLTYLLLIVVGILVFTPFTNAETLEQKIVKSAGRHGVDPTLALAMAQVESRLDDSMVGGLGEIGVFQMRPEFHPVVKGRTDYNIDLAIRYIAKLQDQCRGYGDAFFVCYNYGAKRKLKYPKLFPYYRKVKLAQQHLKAFNVANRN